MHVVDLVGNDVGKRGQGVIGQIGGKLRERHHVVGLLRHEVNIAIEGKRIVRLHVRIGPVAGVPNAGQVFHIRLPAHAILA